MKSVISAFTGKKIVSKYAKVKVLHKIQSLIEKLIWIGMMIYDRKWPFEMF